jgi:ribosomal protein S18 acetylase RimI-like enzyme
MLIEPAAEEDVPAVVALVESAYRGDSSRAGWTTEADLLDGQRTDPDEVRSVLPSLLVARSNGELLGCCVLEQRDDHGYFGMFAVRPSGQGSGTGSALLAAAEARARTAGLSRVEMTVLSSRAELIAFYERRGYTDSGQTKPFPYGDQRFGLPKVDDLQFLVLIKDL